MERINEIKDRLRVIELGIKDNPELEAKRLKLLIELKTYWTYDQDKEHYRID